MKAKPTAQVRPAKARQPRRSPEQVIAAILLPDGPPAFCEALCDHEVSASFEQLRDSIRGQKYNDWLRDVCKHQDEIAAHLPEGALARCSLSSLCDAYGDEEQTSMEAAFQVGIEVGKRMVRR